MDRVGIVVHLQIPPMPPVLYISIRLLAELKGVTVEFAVGEGCRVTLTRAPMTPRLVRRRYSKGRVLLVVFRNGYRKRGTCAAEAREHES